MKFKKAYFIAAHNAIVEAIKTEISNNSTEFINYLDELTNKHDDFIPRCANTYVVLNDDNTVSYFNKKTGEQGTTSIEDFYANHFFFNIDTLAEDISIKHRGKKFWTKSIKSAVRKYSFTQKTYEKWLASQEG